MQHAQQTPRVLLLGAETMTEPHEFNFTPTGHYRVISDPQGYRLPRTEFEVAFNDAKGIRRTAFVEGVLHLNSGLFEAKR